MVKHVESTVGITVLFDENLTEQDIQGLGEIIHQRPEIREMYYISAEDAWNMKDIKKDLKDFRYP